jgi:DNA-binding response OmpR family regulator
VPPTPRRSSPSLGAGQNGPMAKARILVVDDAPEIAEVVVAVLTQGGYETRVASDGAGGLAAARAWDPDVVVLDLTLPDLDGVEVCRQLRTFTEAYVLMLTARADEIDRVVGLTMGADDYVTKPFSPRELGLRVDALLRRRRPAPAAPPEPEPAPAAEDDGARQFGALRLDPESREVHIDGKLVETTRMEFDLLDALTEAPKRVLTRPQLRERVWGGGWFGDDHAVDVHVSNLRKKLAAAGAPAVVATVRGVGYRLAPDLLDGRGAP